MLKPQLRFFKIGNDQAAEQLDECGKTIEGHSCRNFEIMGNINGFQRFIGVSKGCEIGLLAPAFKETIGT